MVDAGVLLVVHGDVRQNWLERISCLTAELASSNLMLEQQIQLGVGKVLRVGQAEPGPHQEQSCHASPQERTLGSPVPVVPTHHLGHDGIVDEDS